MGWRGGPAPQPVHGDDHRPARRAATAGLAGSGSAINIPLPPTPQSKSSSKHTVTSSNYGAFQDHLPAIVYTKPRGLCSIMGVSDLNPAQVEQALLPLGHGGMRLQQCSEDVADVARLSSVSLPQVVRAEGVERVFHCAEVSPSGCNWCEGPTAVERFHPRYLRQPRQCCSMSTRQHSEVR